MNRAQQRQTRLVKLRHVVNTYMSNRQNGATTAKIFGLTRERIRQLLNEAITEGLMSAHDKKIVPPTRKMFPAIERIINSGGDILDIMIATKLPSHRISWAFRALVKGGVFTKEKIREVGMDGERKRLSRYFHNATISGDIIMLLYDNIEPVAAKNIYLTLKGLKPIRYQTVYSVLSQLHTVGVLQRPSIAKYQLSPDTQRTVGKYLVAMKKGGKRV